MIAFQSKQERCTKIHNLQRHSVTSLYAIWYNSTYITKQMYSTLHVNRNYKRSIIIKVWLNMANHLKRRMHVLQRYTGMKHGF